MTIGRSFIKSKNGFSPCFVHLSSRTTITPANANVPSASLSSIHALGVAFGYLKIIEKHQPKYVDKLTPHITKLLQKLIKDHTSAGNDYNPGKLLVRLRFLCLSDVRRLAFTEYIVECLNLLRYRIGQLTSDLRKQFMHNFLPVSRIDVTGESNIRFVRSV